MAIKQYGDIWQYQWGNDGLVIITTKDIVLSGGQLQFAYEISEGVIHDFTFNCTAQSDTSDVNVAIVIFTTFDCFSQSNIWPIAVTRLISTQASINVQSLTSNILVTTPGEVDFTLDILAASNTSDIAVTQLIEYTVVTMLGISSTSLVDVDLTIDYTPFISVESLTSDIDVTSLLQFFPDIDVESLTSQVLVDLSEVTYFSFDCTSQSLTSDIASSVIRSIVHYCEGISSTSSPLASTIVLFSIDISSISETSLVEVLLTTLAEFNVVIAAQSSTTDISITVTRLVRPLVITTSRTSQVGVINDHLIEVYLEGVSITSDVLALIASLGIITDPIVVELEHGYVIEELGGLDLVELGNEFIIIEEPDDFETENTELILDIQDRHFTSPGIGNWQSSGIGENYNNTLRCTITPGFNFVIADLFASNIGDIEDSIVIIDLLVKLGPSNLNDYIYIGFNTLKMNYWKDYVIENMELDKWYRFSQIYEFGSPIDLQNDSLWVYLIGNVGDYFLIDQVSMKKRLTSAVPNNELNYVYDDAYRIDMNKNFNSQDEIGYWTVSGNGTLEYDSTDIGFVKNKLVLTSIGGPLLEAKLSLDHVDIQPSKEYTISALVHIPSGNAQSVVSIKTEDVIGVFNSNQDKICPLGSSILHQTVIGFAEDVTGSLVIGFASSQLAGDKLYFTSFSVKENIIEGRGIKNFVNYAPLTTGLSKTSEVICLVTRDIAFNCNVETLTSCRARGAWKPLNYIASPDDLTDPQWVRNRTIHTVDGIIPTIDDESHYAREDSLPIGNLFLYQIKLKMGNKSKALVQMRNPYYEDNEGLRFRYPGIRVDLETGTIIFVGHFPSGWYMSSTPDVDGFYLCQVELTIKDLSYPSAVYIYLIDEDGEVRFPGDGVSIATRAKNVKYLESTDIYVAFAVEAKSETSSPNVNGVFDASNNLIQSPNDLTTWWLTARAFTTVDAIIAEAVDGNHYVYNNTGDHPVDIYFDAKLKEGGKDWARLQIYDGTDFRSTYFDVANGDIGLQTNPIAGFYDKDLDGWRKCFVVGSGGPIISRVYIMSALSGAVSQYLGDGVTEEIYAKEIRAFLFKP